ncbi:MAG: GGDEF domain-containing protein [Candidatus Omnitrophota bacterium]
MFFWIAIILIFSVYIFGEIFFLRKLRKNYYRKKDELSEKYNFLKKEEESLKQETSLIEDELSKQFLFYDLARKIAPFLSIKDLFAVFSEEIRHLGPIEDIGFHTSLEIKGYLKFQLSKNSCKNLYIKSRLKEVIDYIPYFANLLRLCVERIELYDKLQQLVIIDSLTKAYNRRYFMVRFIEEFERAKKFNLNLSFLMIDIDYFKKINDTYGHLVGDVVLKEVSRLILESIREIDFAARYGGEEFSVILPETDKVGAIMVAERINSRISQERIRVFDEVLTANVSIGIASFPQNAIHSDVLMETADKALYKAKLSGRDRVCWF